MLIGHAAFALAESDAGDTIVGALFGIPSGALLIVILISI